MDDYTQQVEQQYLELVDNLRNACDLVGVEFSDDLRKTTARLARQLKQLKRRLVVFHHTSAELAAEPSLGEGDLGFWIQGLDWLRSRSQQLTEAHARLVELTGGREDETVDRLLDRVYYLINPSEPLRAAIRAACVAAGAPFTGDLEDSATHLAWKLQHVQDELGVYLGGEGETNIGSLLDLVSQVLGELHFYYQSLSPEQRAATLEALETLGSYASISSHQLYAALQKLAEDGEGRNNTAAAGLRELLERLRILLDGHPIQNGSHKSTLEAAMDSTDSQYSPPAGWHTWREWADLPAVRTWCHYPEELRTNMLRRLESVHTSGWRQEVSAVLQTLPRLRRMLLNTADKSMVEELEALGFHVSVDGPVEETLWELIGKMRSVQLRLVRMINLHENGEDSLPDLELFNLSISSLLRRLGQKLGGVR